MRAFVDLWDEIAERRYGVQDPTLRRFRYGVGEEEDQIGAVTGLAWTEVGGELLTIEAVTVPGKGLVKTTGKLGWRSKKANHGRKPGMGRAQIVNPQPDVMQRRLVHTRPLAGPAGEHSRRPSTEPMPSS